MRQAVRAGARHLAYLEGGDRRGPALVLLHAFPLTSDMWRPQLASPPAGWRVIAPDLSGLGSSDDHDRPAAALDDYAADVMLVLDRLGVTRAAVAGVSLGGYVALALARLHPERLSALVLADTRAGADSPEGRAGRDRMLGLLDEHGTAGVADEMLPKLLGETTRREQSALVERARAIILANDPAGVRRAILRLRDRPDATPGLGAIGAPTLVVVGAEDVVTPLAEAERLASRIPRARLETVPLAGHLSNFEQPDHFNQVLARFLAHL